MSAALLLLAVFLFRSGLWAQGNGNPPTFPPDSVVNSANGNPASLTPNVIATLYGSDLAFSTEAADSNSQALPTLLAGVRVIVGGIFASLLYVSPTQVNFIMPASLVPGQTGIYLHRDFLTTATVPITLLDAAPALFEDDSGIAAEHADGSLISADAPAHPDEVIVVYGTGLGRTNPTQIDGTLPQSAARIILFDQLRVLLDGQAVPVENILYAGITPGFAGLYQINLRLPDEVGATPELRIALGDQMSQGALRLQVAPAGP